MKAKYIHYLFRQGSKAIFLAYLIVLVFFYSTTVKAGIVNNVSVVTIADGYEVTIHFDSSIMYQSHTPIKASDFLRIGMRTVNKNSLYGQDVESSRGRVMLSWDRKTNVPIKEITFEGDPIHPQLSLVFTKKVEFDVRSSADLRSLIVTIKSKKLPLKGVVKEDILEKNGERVSGEIVEEVSDKERAMETEVRLVSTEKLSITAKKLVKLMENANTAMTEGRYRRAVQLYTKILKTADGDIKKQAQEFLGFARERNDQFAHAKSEYEKYLKEYPAGPDAVRVRQRLAGLLTAAKKPKKRIVEVNRHKEIVEKPKWQIRNYGNYSNFFYRDQTSQKDGKTRVYRNDLYTNIDVNSRMISENYDMRYKYTGSYQNIFLPDKKDQTQLSALSFEIRHKKSDLYGKLGRQSRYSGGVLGRFDGIHVSYDITPKIVVNGVFGFPVESSKQTNVETDKKFYGVSADFGTYNEHWDYTAFFIKQDNNGVTDRSAIGGEIRYFDQKKSFFTLLDYDVFFNTLNIFLFNGNWTLPTKTTLNIIYDYRRSPMLMTNNAIQGQGVDELDSLFGRYTDDELKALAEDRSGISKSITFGVTQRINDDIQLAGDFTVSRLEGTVSSGGVDAVPGTGNEYYSSLQLIVNNVFFENDSIVNGIRYSDNSSRNTYTYDISARCPVTRKFRITPKFRIDYRDKKGSDDNRLTMRPQMRIDYRLKKWIRLEVEGGVEWMDNYSSGVTSNSIESFVSAGYRVNF